MKRLTKVIWTFFSIFALLIIAGVSISTADAAPAQPKQKNIILATTTSTQDTGLLDVLIPIFEKKTGYFVKTIAVGSGQAMTMGAKGEADVLLVHS
ncbi:MAG TPA: tungsten ABC transporter substrate-binding protein, partial [Syntrophus sp. (in: bacteria)]|nr:tungsten ABC transporter substrate-binding protein [Syntrophus sp. (in: bacteria)]